MADEIAGASRARKQASLIAALGGGTALTAVVGFAGATNGWRAIFAPTAIVSLLPIPLLGPNRSPPRQRPGRRARRALRRPEVRFVSLVAVPEGAAVFGFVVFFAPALPRLGSSVAVAALGTSAVGLGMLVGGIVARRLTNRVPDAHMRLAGALLLTAGYLLAADTALAPILAAAALAGIGQSGLHSTLQRWATEAAPDARGLSTALFATGAFGGAGLAARAGAVLRERFVASYIAGAASAWAAGVVAVLYRPVATNPPARGPARPSIRATAARKPWLEIGRTQTASPLPLYRLPPASLFGAGRRRLTRRPNHPCHS